MLSYKNYERKILKKSSRLCFTCVDTINVEVNDDNIKIIKIANIIKDQEHKYLEIKF